MSLKELTLGHYAHIISILLILLLVWANGENVKLMEHRLVELENIVGVSVEEE